MRKLMKARRAISPVISALLLILLSVAAGVVAYAYVMGWLGGATKTPATTYGKLQFDSLYGDQSASLIKMYIRNVGGKDLKLEKIYVDGVEKANATAITTPVDILVNEVKYLECTVTMTKGHFYEVKVTCTDGTAVAQAVEAK